MQVMILGAGGMLGHDLVASAPAGITVRPFTHAELDIARPKALMMAVELIRPDVVINAAAYTAVDQAEANRGIAFDVNAAAVVTLGSLAARQCFRVVHISTDYVFDGEARTPYSEDSEPRPINVYGASKLAGERALESSGAEFLIVRTQWLFGMHGRSFPRTMWERARSGAITKVVNDQFGRPTYTADLAQSIWGLTVRGVRGLCHVANTGEASWFDVAKQVFHRANRLDLLSPCASKDYPTAARRPRHSVLGLEKSERDTGGRLRNWSEALDELLTLLER